MYFVILILIFFNAIIIQKAFLLHFFPGKICIIAWLQCILKKKFSKRNQDLKEPSSKSVITGTRKKTEISFK